MKLFLLIPLCLASSRRAGSECDTIRASATVFYWLLIACLNFGCQAENHYCNNGIISPIRFDKFKNRDNTILPVVLGETDQTKRSNKSCIWSIESIPTTSGDLQLVLQATLMDSDAGIVSLPKSDDQKSPAELVIKYSGRKLTAKVGMFFVRPISLLVPLTVEASWDPKSQSASQVKLRILVILPGFCNGDMLSFNGNCYAVSKVRTNLTAAMSAIRGDAQLASFSSISEIDSLIAANAARLSMHPYRRPLSLSKTVRLGMFYRAVDASVLSLVRNGSGGCALQPVFKPAEFVGSGGTAGPCLALKVDTSDTAVVEFSNCSSSMLVLIKFPENRRIASKLESCNIQSVNTKFLSRAKTNAAESTEQSRTTSLPPSTQSLRLWATSEKPSPKSPPASKVPVSFGVACAIVLAILLVILVIVYTHRKKCSFNNCAIQNARKEESEISNGESAVLEPLISSENENFPLEALPDGAPDTSSNSAADVAPATPSNSAADGEPDTPSNSAADGAPDTPSNSAADGEPDTPSNSAADGEPDTPSNSAADGEPDTPSNSAADGARATPPSNAAPDGEPGATHDVALGVATAALPDGRMDSIEFELYDCSSAQGGIDSLLTDTFYSFPPDEVDSADPESHQSSSPIRMDTLDSEPQIRSAPAQFKNENAEAYDSPAQGRMDSLDSDTFYSLLAPDQMDSSDPESH